MPKQYALLSNLKDIIPLEEITSEQVAMVVTPMVRFRKGTTDVSIYQSGGDELVIHLQHVNEITITVSSHNVDVQYIAAVIRSLPSDELLSTLMNNLTNAVS